MFRNRPLWQSFADAFKAVFWNRLALFLVTWIAGRQPSAPARLPEFDSLFGDLMRWDAYFYFNIARAGYTNITDTFEHRDTNFWPLFPWMWRLVHYALPSWQWSGFVLNFALLVVAVWSIDDIAKRVLSRTEAALVPTLFLCHPFSFYYSAYYTEAAFVCFSALSLALAYRRRWAFACLAAGLAAGTRMVGVAAGVAVIVAYVESLRFDIRKVDRNVLWLPLVALGTVVYVSYLALTFHEPLAFTAGLSARDWGAAVTWDRFAARMHTLVNVAAWPMQWIEAIDIVHVIVLVATAAVTLGALGWLRPSLAIFGLIALFLSGRYWTNAGRYCAPIFPTAIVLARWLAPRTTLRLALVTLGLTGSSIIAWMYAHAYWIS